MNGIDLSWRVWEDRNVRQEEVLIRYRVDLNERP